MRFCILLLLYLKIQFHVWQFPTEWQPEFITFLCSSHVKNDLAGSSWMILYQLNKSFSIEWFEGDDYEKLEGTGQKAVLASFQVVSPGRTAKDHKIFGQEGQFLATI